MSYAKVLGATNRKDGYLEGNGYLVSWCVGHLVELAPPNVYDAKYVKWSIADLPILPQKWQYLVSVSTKKQFGILQKLMHRPDVDSIVNSCDSGREGELIFRLVYQQAGCKKPFSRLWLSSMEENAIREGFAHLKPCAGCRAATGQFQIHRVEFLRHKGGNGGFPHHRHGKHRGHNTPHRQRLTVQARKKPGRVDADHPVGAFPA